MAEFVYRYCQHCHAKLKTREQVRGLCTACRRVAPLVCVHCGNPAACVGRYEMAAHDEPACDECCGHACEDGLCVTVAAYEAAGRNWRRAVRSCL